MNYIYPNCIVKVVHVEVKYIYILKKSKTNQTNMNYLCLVLQHQKFVNFGLSFANQTQEYLVQ